MLLENTFPGGRGRYYAIQDDLGPDGDGTRRRVDATISFPRAEGAIKLAIDSKFPFADYRKLFDGPDISEEEKAALGKSFKQAVRARVQEVARRYIVPGTTIDSAVVFIPSDGVFAYISSHYPDVLSEARTNKVIVCCPSTLQAIIVLFHNAVVDSERNKNLEVINEELDRLGEEFGRFAERWDSLSRTISSLEKKSGDFSTTVKKIGIRFNAISKNQLANAGEKPLAYEENNLLEDPDGE